MTKFHSSLWMSSIPLCVYACVCVCVCMYVSVSCSVVSDSLQHHGLYLTRLLCPWTFPGKSTGVGCHFLLQGIFLTQQSNSGLLHCRQILHHLSHQGRPQYSTVCVYACGCVYKHTHFIYIYIWASLIAQLVKNLPPMQKTQFHLWVGKIRWRRDRRILGLPLWLRW